MDHIERIGRMIDEYAARVEPALRRSVAARREGEGGVPAEMWAGDVNADGWVEWKVLPSTLTPADVQALEAEFAMTLPPTFRAYLLARFHCFDQFSSARHDQLILLPALPAREPLKELREILRAWRILLSAELIPFAEWGDGWGPMCFDARRRRSDGECPVLWLDHEEIIPLGDKAAVRSELARFEQPLYESFDEMLQDIFGRGD